MTIPVDLDRLDALEKAATPGPWEWHFEDASVLAINGPGHLEDHVLWAQVCPACQKSGGRCTAPSDADANAIVRLRNAYPAMSAELRALRAEVERLRAVRDAAEPCCDALRDIAGDGHRAYLDAWDAALDAATGGA